MTLIKSISGIRGTIGGQTGDTLNPLDIVKFTTAYATFIKKSRGERGERKVVVGRDGRISGPMVRDVVCGTLVGMGYEVIDIGLATTPTTELAVRWHEADGGIIITASHNPTQWNALKLLNSEGEFLTAADGAEVLRIAEAEDFDYAPVEKLGHVVKDDTMNQRHVDSVLQLRLADVEAIRQRKFRVCADTINSVGGIILPELFEALGVDYEILNGECTGQFAHNPEPLEKNLQGIMDKMHQGGFDLGIVVDPDVDRLAFICEDGRMFGEEYTLVSVADYVLSQTENSELSARPLVACYRRDARTERCDNSQDSKTNHTSQFSTLSSQLTTVSNLSSTRALRDVTEKHGGKYTAAAVGEVNVTTKMKEVGAVIGGEGNGGVIYPESHYGRDALVGIALFLSSLAQKGCTASELRATFPDYQIAKNRIDLTPETDVDAILVKVKEMFAKDPEAQVNDIDGVKIDFPTKWVHLRKSNTEPIIRVYSEAQTMEEADELGKRLMQVVYDMQ
jgi:phosphomannomutase